MTMSTTPRALGALAAAMAALTTLAAGAATPAATRAPAAAPTASIYEQRERDWRQGAVVYQVLVDRFAPSARLDEKRALYAPPKVLRGWDEVPKPGPYLESERLSSHELHFWGGDIASLASRLDHIQGLGVDAIYLQSSPVAP